jgi:hypothetical protein
MNIRYFGGVASMVIRLDLGRHGHGPRLCLVGLMPSSCTLLGSLQDGLAFASLRTGS